MKAVFGNPNDRLVRQVPALESIPATSRFALAPLRSFMHCVELAKLASIVALHGPDIARHPARSSVMPLQPIALDPLPGATTPLADYWIKARIQFDLWNRVLARHAEAEKSGGIAALGGWWKRHRVVLEEILVGEILCRVLGTLANLTDRIRGHDEWAPVAQTVFLTHMDVSNRVHRTILHRGGQPIRDAVCLNRLRAAVDRWSDTLIGQLLGGVAGGVPESDFQFACDGRRASGFAEDRRSWGLGPVRRTASQLLSASMDQTLRHRTTARPALPASNAALASSVIRMVGAHWFDGWGVPRQERLARIAAAAGTRSDDPSDPVSTNDTAAESQGDLDTWPPHLITPIDDATIRFLESMGSELEAESDRWFLG
ncbi:MAG: hypothetical protein AAF958_08840 [Planctomycetota bacterium]